MVRLANVSTALFLVIGTLSTAASVKMEGSNAGGWTNPQTTDNGMQPTLTSNTPPALSDMSIPETMTTSSSSPPATEQPQLSSPNLPPTSPPSSPPPIARAPAATPPPTSASTSGPAALDTPSPIPSTPAPDTTVTRPSESPTETPKPSSSVPQPVSGPTSPESSSASIPPVFTSSIPRTMKAVLSVAVASFLGLTVSPTSAALSTRRLQFTPPGNAQGPFRPAAIGPQNPSGPWGIPGPANGGAPPGAPIGAEAAVPAGGNGAGANEADVTTSSGPGTVAPAASAGATSDIPPGQPTIMVLLPDFLAGSGSHNTVDVGETEKPKEAETPVPTPASAATTASLGFAATVIAVATVATAVV